MRLVWIGRDLFATALEAALEAGHEAAAIYTSHGPAEALSMRLHATATARGIPVHVGPVGAAEMQAIADLAPDLVVVGGWPKKVPVPADFGLRGVNIHPSLLPEGRGPWPLPHVILKGHRRTGVTLHRLAADFDAGPIVARKAFGIAPWFDLETLVHLSRKIAATLLVETLTDFDEAWEKARPQTGGSWWPRPTRADRILDWNASTDAVFRIARAFGRDGVYGVIDGVERCLVGIDVAEGEGVPGSVLARVEDQVRVATGDGAIDFLIVD